MEDFNTKEQKHGLRRLEKNTLRINHTVEAVEQLVEEDNMCRRRIKTQ